MSRRIDLEGLKAILNNDVTTLAIAKVQKVEVLEDFSVARALLMVFPEEYEVVARVSFPHANMGGGFFTLPNKDDLVLVGFVNKDEVFIISYLSSKDDLIPKTVKEGHTVLRASPKKHLELASDTKGYLSKGADTRPTEPLVLGAVLKTMLTELITNQKLLATKLDELTDMVALGDMIMSTAPGNPAAPNPAKAASITTFRDSIKTTAASVIKKLEKIQQDYITDESKNIVSKLWFTERGGE